MSKLYKLHAPLGSEFSCPDMEMIPPKTAGNQVHLEELLSQTNVDFSGMARFYQLKPRHQFDRTDAVIFLKLETETNGNSLAVSFQVTRHRDWPLSFQWQPNSNSIPNTPSAPSPVPNVQLRAGGKREPRVGRVIRRSKLWQ